MLALWKTLKGSVGLVATLGGIHKGHVAHFETLRPKVDFLVGSIFLNPTQFSRAEDIDSYPHNENDDLMVFKKNGVDIAFVPTVEEIYTKSDSTTVDPGTIARISEGASRAGHFIGVATVVTKLFILISPDVASFGQKDAQQLQVIKNLIRDLGLKVEIITIPTIRDVDGLAFSTRNQYLNTAERTSASKIYKSLLLGDSYEKNGTIKSEKVIKSVKEYLTRDPLMEIDYLEIVDSVSFKPNKFLENGNILVLAVRIGKARLIDNIILST